MSEGRTLDFDKLMEELKADVLASELSADELLSVARAELRGIRQMLPLYRQAQDDMRYNMTIEDLERQEETLMQLENDPAGLFQYEDYVDLLVETRMTKTVVSDVLLYTPGKAAGKTSGSGCLSGVVVLVVSAIVFRTIYTG